MPPRGEAKWEGIRDKAAIVGTGQTPYGKALGRSEPEMTVEAIWNACEDVLASRRARSTVWSATTWTRPRKSTS